MSTKTLHKCGHNPTEAAKNKWDTDAIKGMLCAGCYFKPKNEEIAAQCRALGLPRLSGTTNQVTWGNHAHLRVAQETNAEVERAVANFRAACRGAREAALQIPHAGYWITLKDEPASAFLPAWITDWAHKHTNAEWPDGTL